MPKPRLRGELHSGVRLTICAKCRKSVVNKVECDACNSTFHPSCAVLFIKGKPGTHCCVRALSYLLIASPTTASAIYSSSLPLPPLHTLRAPQITSSTSSSSPLLISFSTGPTTHETHSIPVPLLPSLRFAMGSEKVIEQRLDRLLNAIEGIKQDTVAIRRELASLTIAVEKNTATCNALANDVDYLKHSAALAGPTAELTINGIPDTCALTYQDIFVRVLTRLKLSSLHTDVLAINKIEHRASVSTTPSFLNTPTSRYFALRVHLKSVDIRNFIIDTKRKVGKITLSELFPEISEPTNANRLVFVNEFLPSSTYALLRKAKDIAKKAGYKRVWARNANVFVRKDGGIPEIIIATEQDLNKIV